MPATINPRIVQSRLSQDRTTPARIQLGDYWLDWREDREHWCIAWYDRAARTRRRRSLGLGGGTPDDPPEEARQALARHYLEAGREQQPAQPLGSVAVGELFTSWLSEHVSKKAAPERYAQSVEHWLRFFKHERAGARILTSGAMVSDINRALVDRFISWRKSEGVGGHTISRDLAALRGALNHAWRHERIATVPFVREVDPKDKAPPRDKVLTSEQIAAMLDAAASKPEWQHIRLYILIQMSTAARTNAILELDSSQIRDGLIQFRVEGEAETSKRRATVPIAPTLWEWLKDAQGHIITYKVPIAAKKREPNGPTHYTRPCIGNGSIRRAWASVCKEAKVTGATPNTLRHTIITELHRRGVPEAQIETAAGHRGEGTNKRNYRHLRPDYLAELIIAVEAYWQDLKRHTTTHLRTQCGPNVVMLPPPKRKTL